ncbi:MAG: hypothetical protein QM808_12345 [Steroidobacteraceae bacterium]
MANLRYFYYGSNPGTLSDRLLYVIFFPPYTVALRLQQSLQGERNEVHWRDRR